MHHRSDFFSSLPTAKGAAADWPRPLLHFLPGLFDANVVLRGQLAPLGDLGVHVVGERLHAHCARHRSLLGEECLGLGRGHDRVDPVIRSEEHTSELQSLMRISYAVFCLKKKKPSITTTYISSI